jgi:hypothetical protein
MPREEFLKFDYEKFIQFIHPDGDASHLTHIENKENSFGILDGKVVAIDYA